jgi:hypothetical protein
MFFGAYSALHRCRIGASAGNTSKNLRVLHLLVASTACSQSLARPQLSRLNRCYRRTRLLVSILRLVGVLSANVLRLRPHMLARDHPHRQRRSPQALPLHMFPEGCYMQAQTCSLPSSRHRQTFLRRHSFPARYYQQCYLPAMIMQVRLIPRLMVPANR